MQFHKDFQPRQITPNLISFGFLLKCLRNLVVRQNRALCFITDPNYPFLGKCFQVLELKTAFGCEPLAVHLNTSNFNRHSRM